MSQIQLYFLGAPYIEKDGEESSVDTRKAIALLAYIALNGHRHSRDTLAAMLWPENDDSGARAALRRTLSTLNKAVDGIGIQADRESIEFIVDDSVWIDVLAFERILEAAADLSGDQLIASMKEAVSLYRDDFMSGFSLRDSAEFDRWQYTQAEHYRRKLAGALEILVDAFQAAQLYEEAVDYARHWLALDPLHEPVHRRLMHLYAIDNQRSMALRQYRECVQVLDRELGVAPLEETTRLYEAIKENRIGQPAAVTTAMADPTGVADQITVPVTFDLPFVGRDGELAALQSRYRQTAAGSQIVVVEGEPGIGKTRLTLAFGDLTKVSGHPTISVSAYATGAQVAYGLIVNLLRDLISRQGDKEWMMGLPESSAAEVARLYPAIEVIRPEIQPAPVSDPAVARTRLFEAISEHVGAFLASHPGTVFVLEDIHWTDNSSAELLSYLLRRLSDQPAMFVLTWRTDDIQSDHPVLRLLTDGQHKVRIETLLLPRLSREAVAALVEQTLSSEQVGGDYQAVEDRLYEESEGLPLFVAEFLRLIIDEGFDQGQPIGMPMRAQDLLRSRLARLQEIEEQILATASVIGRSFSYDVLRAVSGRSEDETVGVLESLLAKGLIREVGSGPLDDILYDFYHNKLRSLLYEEISLVRKRLLHRRVADYLAERSQHGSNTSPDYAAIAHHYELAHADEEAASYHFLAGEEAQAVYAHREAISHLDSALALGYPDAVQVHMQTGDLRTLLGHYREAITSYETAAAMAPADEVAAIDHKLGQVHHRAGEWDLAVSYYQAALEAIGEQSNGQNPQARIKADWSLTAHRQGRVDEAHQLAQEVIALSDQSDDQLAQAQAYNVLGILARNEADFDAGLGYLNKSLEIAEALSDRGAQIAALNNLALAHRDKGDLDQALDLAERALILCEQYGDRHREAALHSNFADLLHAAGETDRSQEHVRRSAEILTEIDRRETAYQPEIWKLIEW